ncbi:MAG: mRNA interferase MazF [Verrucomicrobiota bacterium]
MSINPKPGEVYFVDLGIAQKPRSILLVSVRDEDAPLAIATGLSFTTQFHQSRYEVVLPKLPWMREQSHVNAQSLAGYKFVELQRLVGKLDASVMQKVQGAVRAWLGL